MYSVIICPIAIAQHGTDYKITSVTLLFCHSVCKHSCGRNFDSILIKFCTAIRSPKSKIEFASGENPMSAFPILPQFLIPVMHFQWEGSCTTVENLVGSSGCSGV